MQTHWRNQNTVAESVIEYYDASAAVRTKTWSKYSLMLITKFNEEVFQCIQQKYP